MLGADVTGHRRDPTDSAPISVAWFTRGTPRRQRGGEGGGGVATAASSQVVAVPSTASSTTPASVSIASDAVNSHARPVLSECPITENLSAAAAAVGSSTPVWFASARKHEGNDDRPHWPPGCVPTWHPAFSVSSAPADLGAALRGSRLQGSRARTRQGAEQSTEQGASDTYSLHPLCLPVAHGGATTAAGPAGGVRNAHGMAASHVKHGHRQGETDPRAPRARTGAAPTYFTRILCPSVRRLWLSLR